MWMFACTCASREKQPVFELCFSIFVLFFIRLCLFVGLSFKAGSI